MSSTTSSLSDRTNLSAIRAKAEYRSCLKARSMAVEVKQAEQIDSIEREEKIPCDTEW